MASLLSCLLWVWMGWTLWLETLSRNTDVTGLIILTGGSWFPTNITFLTTVIPLSVFWSQNTVINLINLKPKY